MAGVVAPSLHSCHSKYLANVFCANSLKAERFFNFFEKLKKRWKNLKKDSVIREGENFFCEGVFIFREGVFIFREGVFAFCEGGSGVRSVAVLLPPVPSCESTVYLIGCTSGSSLGKKLVLPINGRFAMGSQVFVSSAEMLVAEESIVCGEWRRMSGGQYQMLVSVDECALFLSVCSP